jgi:hypothetical protein
MHFLVAVVSIAFTKHTIGRAPAAGVRTHVLVARLRRVYPVGITFNGHVGGAYDG